MRISALVLIAAVVGMPAFSLADEQQATGTTATTQAPASAPASDPDQIICKSQAAPTGSRLGGHRECHTQKEWDAQQQDSRKNLEDAQTRGLQGGMSGH